MQNSLLLSKCPTASLTANIEVRERFAEDLVEAIGACVFEPVGRGRSKARFSTGKMQRGMSRGPALFSERLREGIPVMSV